MKEIRGSVFFWAEEERTFGGDPKIEGPTFSVVFKKWLGNVTFDEIIEKIGEEKNKSWQFCLKNPAELSPKTKRQYRFSFLTGNRRMRGEIIGLFVPCGVELREVITGLADFKHFGRSPKIISGKDIEDSFLALLLNNT